MPPLAGADEETRARRGGFRSPGAGDILASNFILSARRAQASDRFHTAIKGDAGERIDGDAARRRATASAAAWPLRRRIGAPNMPPNFARWRRFRASMRQLTPYNALTPLESTADARRRDCSTLHAATDITAQAHFKIFSLRSDFKTHFAMITSEKAAFLVYKPSRCRISFILIK